MQPTYMRSVSCWGNLLPAAIAICLQSLVLRKALELGKKAKKKPNTTPFSQQQGLFFPLDQDCSLTGPAFLMQEYLFHVKRKKTITPYYFDIHSKLFVHAVITFNGVLA